MSFLKRRSAFGAIASLVACGAALVAQSGQSRVTPSEVKWPAVGEAGVGTSGTTGVQTVILKGDPTKPGLYTLLLRVAPHTRIESHSHPDDRVATVVAGTWYFGYGKQLNESALKVLPAGSFYTEPPNTDHFAMTRQDTVVIQITGSGPSGTTYVDSRNDPVRK